jgi:iron complex transport system ATP-binding protein
MDALFGNQLVVGYGNKKIIDHQSIHIAAGQITGLIGPNGSGKSTLLKAISGIKSVNEGQVFVNEREIGRLSTKQRAKCIAYLAQSPNVPGDLTVENLVKLGRYAYGRGLFGRDQDAAAQVQQALVAAKVAELANRPIDALSGGQRQRAFIAMTLAHNSPIIMLDEPTTYLDLTHQLDVLNLLRQLNTTAHKTVVLVLHDLNQAAQYCDQLVCLQQGQIVATGTPHEVLTEQLLADVFQVSAKVSFRTQTQYPQMTDYETLVNR